MKIKYPRKKTTLSLKAIEHHKKSNNDSKKTKKYSFHRFVNKSLKPLLITILFLFLFLIIYFIYSDRTIFIDSFEVPESIEKENISSDAIVNKLIDRIEFIKNHAAMIFEDLIFKSSDSELSYDIEILQTKFPLKFIFNKLRSLIGKNNITINGEVISFNDSISLTIRYGNYQSENFPGTVKEINKILLEAALYVLKYVNPILVSTYLINNDKKERMRQ